MSEVKLSPGSGYVGECDEDLGFSFVKPPTHERTCAAIAGPVEELAAHRLFVSIATAPPVVWLTPVLPVRHRFFAGSDVLLLDDTNFPDDLQRILIHSSGEGSSASAEDAELGSPRVDVLLEAVDDLTAWTGLTKQALAKYLGFSYSTVMSWRRERPERPRHPRISTLLALWSAVSGAQEEFGVEDTARMIWATGATDEGLPAVSADDLATWLVNEASEANLSEFLSEDGFEAGTAEVPAEDQLAMAEGRLHQSLERHSRTSYLKGGR